MEMDSKTTCMWEFTLACMIVCVGDFGDLELICREIDLFVTMDFVCNFGTINYNCKKKGNRT